MQSCWKNKKKTEYRDDIIQEQQVIIKQEAIPVIQLTAPLQRQIRTTNQRYTTLSEEQLIERLRKQKLSLQRENIQQSKQIEHLQKALQQQGNFFIKRTERTRRENVELQKSVNILQQSILTNTIVNNSLIISKLDNSEYQSSQINRYNPYLEKEINQISQIHTNLSTISNDSDQGLKLIELSTPIKQPSPARPSHIINELPPRVDQISQCSLKSEQIDEKQNINLQVVQENPCLYLQIFEYLIDKPIEFFKIQFNQVGEKVVQQPSEQLQNSVQYISSAQQQCHQEEKKEDIFDFEIHEIIVMPQLQNELIILDGQQEKFYQDQEYSRQSHEIIQACKSSNQNINKEETNDDLYQEELNKEKNYGSFSQPIEIPSITTPSKLGRIELKHLNIE
ncbi:hypothetical protein SS50377_26747 [Spironucleus salmonicida]|uniref:Uncharacterized protein n=1 Tax=Spironucleus salmonicida TaxID=348837 RepID=V6LZP8_9EUKA|nr:hypothetical protein SS50377_26747 [Spironucleus salmonicida]|eukprot:EST49216.1 Hypothetical protein SS50377_10435 [Spironucleus salmonicida]